LERPETGSLALNVAPADRNAPGSNLGVFISTSAPNHFVPVGDPQSCQFKAELDLTNNVQLPCQSESRTPGNILRLAQ
jgi:hypothetical protein